MDNRHLLDRSLALLALGLAIFASDAWSACQVPQPRLVCAESANSQAVVIAKLVGIRDVVRDSDTDGHFYRLTTRTRLRGQIDPTFQVWEENTSGRATFAWTRATDYLLFASYSKQDHAWVIDGCGNSGPLNRSASVLAAIKSINAAADGLVEGMASTDSLTTGVPDVAITAIGSGMTFAAKTDQDGRFKVRLPAGRYRMEAIRRAWSFEPTPFSYENPNDLILPAGGCAQVQFSGIRNK